MYKVNSKSVSIKFDASVFNSLDVENKTKALCILLGGYNKYGREVDVDYVKDLQEKFVSLIYQLNIHMK